MSWVFEQKEILPALYSDMSKSMVHGRLFRKLDGDLENAIRSICIEIFSTKEYINSMEEITTRTKIGKNWHKTQIDNKTSGKPIPIPNKPQERAPLKCLKLESTSHLTNTCPKKTIINEIDNEKSEDTKEKADVSFHESDSEPSEEEEFPDTLSTGKINASFEVTELHTHLP
ncbi:hypothetical protein O181_008257 [Austropuccinia psidii MF-1]|uniref:Uncharacterized protein n=1 Tax=Austropuccinia psidii MF-1 TaxID=1389203 RepID=A0A9Q3BPD4_9BASI|nr:hypothetical protein [Austropuccinia psidii MF-1]